MTSNALTKSHCLDPAQINHLKELVDPTTPYYYDGFYSDKAELNLPKLFERVYKLCGLEYIHLIGSVATQILLKNKKNHNDIDFRAKVQKGGAYSPAGALNLAVAEQIGLEKKIRWKNKLIHSDFIFFTIPTTTRDIDIRIDLNENTDEPQCLSSSKCFLIDILPQISNQATPIASTCKGYELQRSLDLLKKDQFEIALYEPEKSREALRVYVRLAMAGLKDIDRFDGEREFFQKWRIEYGDNGLPDFFKKLPKYLDNHYQDPLQKIIYLMNLRSIFANHSRSLKQFDQLSELLIQTSCQTNSSVDFTTLRTLLFWHLAPNSLANYQVDDPLKITPPRFHFQAANKHQAGEDPWIFATPSWGSTIALLRGQNLCQDTLKLLRMNHLQELQLKVQKILPQIESTCPSAKWVNILIDPKKHYHMDEFLPVHVAALPFFEPNDLEQMKVCTNRSPSYEMDNLSVLSPLLTRIELLKSILLSPDYFKWGKSPLKALLKIIENGTPEEIETITCLVSLFSEYEQVYIWKEIEAQLKLHILEKTASPLAIKNYHLYLLSQKKLSFDQIQKMVNIDPNLILNDPSLEKGWMDRIEDLTPYFPQLIDSSLFTKIFKTKLSEKVLTKALEEGNFDRFIFCWKLANKQNCLPPISTWDIKKITNWNVLQLLSGRPLRAAPNDGKGILTAQNKLKTIVDMIRKTEKNESIRDFLSFHHLAEGKAFPYLQMALLEKGDERSYLSALKKDISRSDWEALWENYISDSKENYLYFLNSLHFDSEFQKKLFNKFLKKIDKDRLVEYCKISAQSPSFSLLRLSPILQSLVEKLNSASLIESNTNLEIIKEVLNLKPPLTFEEKRSILKSSPDFYRLNLLELLFPFHFISNRIEIKNELSSLIVNPFINFSPIQIEKLFQLLLKYDAYPKDIYDTLNLAQTLNPELFKNLKIDPKNSDWFPSFASEVQRTNPILMKTLVDTLLPSHPLLEKLGPLIKIDQIKPSDLIALLESPFEKSFKHLIFELTPSKSLINRYAKILLSHVKKDNTLTEEDLLKVENIGSENLISSELSFEIVEKMDRLNSKVSKKATQNWVKRKLWPLAENFSLIAKHLSNADMEEYISSLPHPQSIDQLKNLYNFLLKNKELLTVKTTFHSLTHTFYFQNEKLMTLATDLFLKAETTDHDFNYLNSLIGEIVYKKPKFYPKFLTLLEIKTFRYLENNPAEISACILTTLTKRSPSFKKVLTNSIERKCTSNSKEIEGCLPFLKKENCPIELIHDILMIIYTHKDKIDHKERMEGLEKQAYEIFWDNFEKLKILNSRSFFNIAENILEFETSEKRRKKLLALFADKPARSTAIVSEEALMEILNGLTGSSKHAKFLFKELNEESK